MKKRLSLFLAASLVFCSSQANATTLLQDNDPRSLVILCIGTAVTGVGIYVLLKNSKKAINSSINIIGGASLIGAGLLAILSSKKLPAGFDKAVNFIT